MKHLRKFWVSLVLLFTVDAHAISIDLVADQTSATTGNLVSVAVTISGLNNMSAPSLGVYDLDIIFDSSLFAFNNLIWGDSSKGNQLDLTGFGSLQSSNLSTGLINLFELSFDDIANLNNGQAGEFTLFTLVFNAIAIGNGHFSLGANLLGDAEGEYLPLNTINNTQVTVTNVTVPEPSSWLLMLGLVAVVALRSRMAQSSK